MLAIILKWFSALVILVVMIWNYNSLFVQHNKRFLPARYKVEFAWWSLWGFNVGIIVLTFILLLHKLFFAEPWGTDHWIDLINLGLCALILVFLFGLFTGHVAIMVYKIQDKRYFGRDTKAGRRGRTAAASITQEEVSVPKILIFSILGSIILYWILVTIILG